MTPPPPPRAPPHATASASSAPAASAPSSRPRCAPPATRSSPLPATPTPRCVRIAALLPGVPNAKPTAVARACDLLLLTVPDDMLRQRRLHARRQRRDPRGPARRAHLRAPRPRRPGARPRGGRPGRRAAPGDDVHRHRARPGPSRRGGCVFGLTAAGGRARGWPSAWSPTSAGARCGWPRRCARSTTPGWPTARTTWSPWSRRPWRCWPPPAPRTPPPRCARS